MKKKFIILGSVLSITLVYEICGIIFSKSMVSNLCKDNIIPVVYSENDWGNWRASVRAIAPEGVDNKVQRKNLEQLAQENKMIKKSYAGYPYGYPYSGVWALRDEIWIDGRKVASISTYQSQTEMGPIQRYIFGGNIGARHSCKDNKIFYKRYMDLMVHEFIIVGNIDRHDYGWRR